MWGYAYGDGSMRWILTLLFFMVLDVGIAILATLVANGIEAPFVFMATLGFLWLMPVGLNLWGAIKFWIAFLLFEKRRMVRYYKAEMYKSKFPASNGYVDWEEYLGFIVTDNDVRPEAKTKAAAFASEIATCKTLRPATLFIGTQIALQRAMDEYQAPPSTSGMFSTANAG